MGCHQPLVADADQRIDAPGRDIDRNCPQRLAGVDHEKGAMCMRQRADCGEIVAIAGVEVDMADDHGAGAIVDDVLDRIEIGLDSLRPGKTAFDAMLCEPGPGKNE